MLDRGPPSRKPHALLVTWFYKVALPEGAHGSTADPAQCTKNDHERVNRKNTTSRGAACSSDILNVPQNGSSMKVNTTVLLLA